MTLTVEVVSQETIKPSSPTPHDLRTFKLALIDQYAPPAHVCLILFYSANHGERVKPDRLKKSLSETLTNFYPLAGRIDSNHFIDCNDEGINFFDTRVSTQLAQVLSHPIPEELDQLLPKDNFYGLGPKVLLSVQINIFDCGGMALGVCISHKVADASSFSLFLNNWAAVSRGENKVFGPKFGLTSFFPPQNVTPFIAPFGTQKVVSKRFVFDASNIAALKAKCSNHLFVEHPTRVEAVSALIWRCAMNVNSSSVASIALDLRKRMVPPLSNLFVGNLMIGTPATSKTESLPELQFLVGQLHEAITKVDADYVKKLQVDDGLSILYDSAKEVTEQSVKGEVDFYIFSSWCRFPFYEADFGWGKPMWISSVNVVCPNIIMLMDTKCGNGVEAWVTLTEEGMVRFECEPDLIAFTSTNPAA